MKGYESVSSYRLTPKIPVLARLDGKAFHTFTRTVLKAEKPYDTNLQECMVAAAKYVCANVSGVQVGYLQSDEISLLFTDYQNIFTQPYFNYGVQKICSVLASMAATSFMAKQLKIYRDAIDTMLETLQIPAFDCRVFSLPREEVVNYFIWRQQDATRNSISMAAQAHFSTKELHKKSCNEMQEMLFKEHAFNWDKVPTRFKRGVSIIRNVYEQEDKSLRTRWEPDYEIPKFTEDRSYIQKHVDVKDET